MSAYVATASGVERLLICPGSAAMPAVYNESADATRGKQLHAYVQAVLGGTPPDVALGAVDDDYRDTCRALDWNRMVGDLHDVRCEVAYALNVKSRTARELGVNIGRGYHRFEITRDEIPGSLDIEGVRADGVPVVGDLKSGFLPITTSEENGQTGLFAIVKRLLTGAPVVEVRIWKLRADGKIYPDTFELTAIDMECLLDELEEAVDRAHSARRRYLAHEVVDVTENDDTCRYCPGKSACPAKNRLARSMMADVQVMGTDEASVRAYIAALPVDLAGAAFLRIKRIKELVESIGGGLRERALSEWLPTTPGKVVRPIAFETSGFSREAAVSLLRELGASDEQIAGLTKTRSVEQVRETNDPRMARVKKTRTRKAVAA